MAKYDKDMTLIIAKDDQQILDLTTQADETINRFIERSKFLQKQKDDLKKESDKFKKDLWERIIDRLRELNLYTDEMGKNGALSIENQAIVFKAFKDSGSPRFQFQPLRLSEEIASELAQSLASMFGDDDDND